jgi:hypothetical protein
MKQTVTAPIATLSLEEVLLKAYPNVGFELEDGEKVILFRLGSKSEFHIARSMDSWSRGDGYNPYGCHTMIISEWAKYFWSLSAEMYSFDSAQELLQWFAE